MQAPRIRSGKTAKSGDWSVFRPKAENMDLSPFRPQRDLAAMQEAGRLASSRVVSERYRGRWPWLAAMVLRANAAWDVANAVDVSVRCAGTHPLDTPAETPIQ
jgi:hypothetical protein